MRLRVLIAVLLAIAALTVVLMSWPFGGSPESSSLAVSFAGYTNTDAMIRVTNVSRVKIRLEPWVRIFHNAEARGEQYPITNTVLPPTATLAIQFPAVTNRIYWKASVVGYRSWEFNWKSALNRAPIVRSHPLWVARLEAQTEWILHETNR